MQKRKISFGAVVTLIVLTAGGLGTAFGFGLIGNTPDFSQQDLTTQKDILAPVTKTKIARPKNTSNLNYTQIIQEGNSLLSKNQLDEALSSFQEAARVSQKESLPYEKLGDIFSLKADFDKASKSYEVAFANNTKNRKLYIKEIRSLLNARKISDAQTLISKAQSKSPEIQYLSALIDAFFNDQQKARDAFIAITQLSSTSEDSTDLTPLETLKKNSLIFGKMYKTFELAKESPLSYLQALLAKNYDQIGEYGLAIETAFNGLKSQNDYRDVWVILGHSFLKTQRWADAEDALTKALALDQQSSAAYMYRGISRVHNKQVRDGIADFTQALSLGYKPRVEVLLQLGDAYYILGLTQKALEYYKQVLTADPESLDLFKRPMSIALFTTSDTNVANDLINIASNNFPNNATVFAWKTILLSRSGNLLDARNYLEKALVLDKQDIYVIVAQADLDLQVGNWSEAEASYKHVIEISSSTEDVLVKQYAQQRIDQHNTNPSSLSLE